MDVIKNMLIDSMNGFSLRFLPLFLFQLLAAGLLGHLLQKILNRKLGTVVIEFGGLIALAICLLVALVKYSLPFAVVGAAVILLLNRSKEQSASQVLALFLIALIGAGCGIGSVIQTIIGFALIAAVILFTPLKK